MTTDLKEKGDISSPQPFLNHAFDYFNLGLPIVPCDSKKPISWKKYQSKKPSQATIYRWLNKYPNANIGIVTGKISNLCVVDCDDNSLSIEDLQNEFGESPFIVSTPRGGKHLYYAFNGEKTKTSYQVRKIDIKAEGGLIIAHFSYSQEKEKYYQIIKGSLEDLTKLQNKCLLESYNYTDDQDFKDCYLKNRDNSQFIIKEGQRNNALFYELKEVARSKRSYDSLLEYAFGFNNTRFDKPLGQKEVESTTKQVWQYKEQDKLWQKSLNLTDKAFKELITNKNAVILFLFLARNHGNYRKNFYISQKEVSKTLQMSENTLREAINFILQKGLLIREKKANEKISKAKHIKAFSYIYKFS